MNDTPPNTSSRRTPLKQTVVDSVLRPVLPGLTVLEHTHTSSPQDPNPSSVNVLAVCPYPKSLRTRQPEAETQPHTSLDTLRKEEFLSLIQAMACVPADTHTFWLPAVHASTYIGKGHVARLAERVKTLELPLCVFDCTLSPLQQKTLEKLLNCKVLDRTAMILEIFRQRARTKEGALQVEYAQLLYQKNRLVRQWTHLERQRGGHGFLGGPGETQIESDRRMLRKRMKKLKLELDHYHSFRLSQRKRRQRQNLPTIALIGYTNSGKSTLFNRLTHAHVFEQDLLFATLDLTTRICTLSDGKTCLCSDTVGFISNLPTMLIEAFHGTLEDIVDATLLLHVEDLSHPDQHNHALDVHAVLSQLGISPESHSILRVWNKIDILPQPEQKIWEERARDPDVHGNTPILISAKTGQGLETLRDAIAALLFGTTACTKLTLPTLADANYLWLQRHTKILDLSIDDEGVAQLSVEYHLCDQEELNTRFPTSQV